jgi:hypothetical protein
VITTLANSEMSVAVDVAYGARITSLCDRVTGREWMLQGGRVGEVSDIAVYGDGDAIGWDECFPTVLPWDASSTVWGTMLRDHGVLWGRPAELVEVSDRRVVTAQAGETFSFRRTLELDGPMLRATYRLQNSTAEPLPYLWAAHCMLRVTPEDRIVLPGVQRVIANHLARDGNTLVAPMLSWPGPNLTWPEPLDRVRPVSAHLAAKLYLADVPGTHAYVGNESGWLRIGWSEEIDSLGIWLNYGGWPSVGEVHHIGLEPTNAPVDDLGAAIARGTPAVPPHGQREWSVGYTLRAPLALIA